MTGVEERLFLKVDYSVKAGCKQIRHVSIIFPLTLISTNRLARMLHVGNEVHGTKFAEATTSTPDWLELLICS